MQCIFTAGWAAVLCRVSSEQRSADSFHQRQKPKNSGRGGERAAENKLSSQGTLLTRYPGKLTCFSGLGRGALRIIWWRQKTPIILETCTCAGVESLPPALHFGRYCSSYLLVVAQLVFQDDAIGLFRLRPRQGEAVHGGADLVHDGNNGGSCSVGEKEQTNGATVLAVNDEKRLVIKMSSSAKHVSHHSITGKKKNRLHSFCHL